MVLRGREGESPYQPTPKEKRGFGDNCYLWSSGYNEHMNTCTIDGCNGKHHARGMCFHHYWAERKSGGWVNARHKTGRRSKSERVKIDRSWPLNELLLSRWGK